MVYGVWSLFDCQHQQQQRATPREKMNLLKFSRHLHLHPRHHHHYHRRHHDHHHFEKWLPCLTKFRVNVVRFRVGVPIPLQYALHANKTHSLSHTHTHTHTVALYNTVFRVVPQESMSSFDQITLFAAASHLRSHFGSSCILPSVVICLTFCFPEIWLLFFLAVHFNNKKIRYFCHFLLSHSLFFGFF